MRSSYAVFQVISLTVFSAMSDGINTATKSPSPSGTNTCQCCASSVLDDVGCQDQIGFSREVECFLRTEASCIVKNLLFETKDASWSSLEVMRF